LTITQAIFNPKQLAPPPSIARPPAGRKPSSRSFRSTGASSAPRALAFAFALVTVVALIALQAASAQAATTYSQVSAGSDYACGVTATGNIECWGENYYGPLGDGTTTDRTRPTDVRVGPGATQVSAGTYSTCAVVSGAAWCWGAGSNAQLGQPNTPEVLLQPRIVPGLESGVTSISIGGVQACAVVNGAAKCWGSGYLGDGNYTQTHVPQQVVGLESGVQSVAVGENGTACAIDVDSYVVCWGQGNYGQIGNGADSAQGIPVRVSNITDAAKVDVGQDFACTITESGAAFCWGYGYGGALGHGSTNPSNVPVAVTGITAGATDISTGSNHACAAVPGGAKCWGQNGRQQLGGSVNSMEATPFQVTGLTSDVSSISAGDKATCAVVSGALSCWGSNGSGQLGNGTRGSAPAPTAITGASTDITDITAGATHSCAIDNGALKCWGSNDYGQLGSGNRKGSQTPQQILSQPGVATSVSTGESFTCAVMGGAAYCWGSAGNGGLGAGGGTNYDSAHMVTGLSSGVTKIAVSGYSACAIVSGAAKCWGFGGYGQLGNGSTTGVQHTPVDVTGLSSGVTDIAVGNEHTCAIASGAATCWGNGAQGALGLGYTSSTTPVQIPGYETGTTGVSVGNSYSCWLKDGGVKCAGVNYYGQLGTGNTTYYNTPTQVIGLTAGVTRLSSGNNSSCVLVSGEARCWGYNSSGESGTGSGAQIVNAPVAVSPAFSNPTSISMGSGHACAIDAGAAKCWGRGDDGELGDGNAYSATPQAAIDPTDTAGPIITFSSPGYFATVTDPDTPITFTVTDNNGTVDSIKCSTDGDVYTDCTSPWSPTLVEGSNVFYVTAIDEAGNSSTEGTGVYLDTQPPNVVIYDQGPSDSSSLEQTIYFYATDDTSSVDGSLQCKIDDGEYEDCNYSLTHTFAEVGTHTITVKATDANGFVGTAVQTYRIDQTVPVINVTSGPRTASSQPVVTFTVADANTYTVICEVDEYSYGEPCTSPWTVPYGMSEGDHNYTIKATDAAGNTSTEYTTVNVDTQGPPVTIDTPSQDEYLADKTPDIGFTVDDAAGDFASTTCSVDTGTAAACTSPWTTPTLAEDGHFVTVTAFDTLGNSSSAVRSFNIDTVGPGVTIDAPEADAALAYGDPYIYWHEATPDYSSTTYSCSFDGIALGSCDSGYYQPSGLADGMHSFTVAATDARGNSDSDTVSFRVDTVDPTVEIGTADNSTITDRTPQLAFTAADGGSGIDTTECAIDGDDEVACTSPFAAGSLADGWHSLAVYVYDKAGNYADDYISFYVDATAPGVTITSPDDGVSTLNHTPTVEFSVDDPHGDLDFVECAVDGGVFDDCSSPFTTGALADGVHVVAVKVTDVYGNSSSDSVSITVTSPVVVVPPVVTPPAGGGAPVVLPLLGKLPASAKYTKPIKVPLTCLAGCTLELSLKIGKKKVKVPGVKVAAGTSSAKISFSKSVKKKIKAGLKKKQKSVLTVRPVGAVGKGAAKSIKLK
jgi:alpha-tubulin suppressor-like RCC1 family protein